MFLERFTCAKFVPLKEVDYKEEYYLDNFVNKWSEIEKNETKLIKLISYDKDLHFIYGDIALIVLRINEDGSKLNQREELWETIRRRKATSVELDKWQSLTCVLDYFNLDVKSLFIHILIFMDKLARFLSSIINKKEERLRSDSFYHFIEDLAKFNGGDIQSFSQLINDNTQWFNKVKEIRDDFIEHHPSASGVIAYFNGKPHAILATTRTGDKDFKHVSVEEIDEILSGLKMLLKNIDEFLCTRIDVLLLNMGH